jgi:hypothetical protein
MILSLSRVLSLVMVAAACARAWWIPSGLWLVTLLDRRRFAAVKNLAKATLFDQCTHIHVGFGPDEVVDRHGYGGRAPVQAVPALASLSFGLSYQSAKPQRGRMRCEHGINQSALGLMRGRLCPPR